MLQKVETPIYRAYRTSLAPLGHDQLSMISYGRFISGGHFSWEQVAPDPCIHVITAGSGTFISNGRPHTVGPGSAYIFYSGDHVKYFDTPESPWQYRWCSLAGPVMALFEGRRIRKGDYQFEVKDMDKVIAAFDWVENACAKDTDASHLGSAALHILLDDIGRPSEDSSSPAVQAKSIIDSWSLDFPTVADVARALGMNRSTLYRCFKQEFGLPVKEYIDNCRLAKAARLLRMSEEPIKAIARSCGYWDQLYFSRAFSKYYGKTPTQWRKLSQEIPTAEQAYEQYLAHQKDKQAIEHSSPSD